ncbi:heavy-metal-associated domain-containing protein [Zeimonas arvi]|uniref:Heavy-metal-associated domain-containing protein n=1 Tax=Zeimonas arvi TaxID=2498847 RepID=A0A5C8NXX8_9BURK|nr:cation transporter [Zeimonas arvi]TXL65902.1 heavy-metal-associated domain-containing protein [Zeimonas arvi]
MNQVFQVEGMSCGHCVHAVTGAIQEIDSAATVRVDLTTGTVEVTSERPRSELAGAIREAGYEIAA